MADLPGQAILDFYQGEAKQRLWIHTTYGKREEMPVETYFRDLDEMSEIEITALKLCRGEVLDIGAAAGSHALILQNQKIDVTALDLSATACDVMKKRSVLKILHKDIFQYEEKKFDTLLLLMNGIGLCGTIEGLKNGLIHFEKILKMQGQLLFDSSDIAYLYEGSIPDHPYYGELEYRYSYKRLKTDPFFWLYIDKETLKNIAEPLGWKCEIIMEDENDQYLACLKRSVSGS